ncbi:glutamate-rich protein 2 isoform X2 [Notolabrus celidotus]|uniref:glutamate-rich protein 2 isoform X2 n=1 Tax=Notolabrus celidotus TaxID=1203425 RepID=UPI00148F715D|nr:glutamate-rich protein 2 isoform X2 [Notolabrus celidotus]
MNRLECLGKSSTISQKQVSCQVTQCSGFPSGDVLNANGHSSKEPIKTTPKIEEQVQQTAVLVEELKIKGLKKAQSTALAQTGMQHVCPEVKPRPSKEEEEQPGEKDEDIKTPVELKIEFLRAVMERDFERACKLCQMILLHEPENPEASEFLPLIKKKLLEEQEAEQSSEEDDDEEDDEDSDDSGSDDDSSESSSCSSSSCSSSTQSDNEDDEEEEKQVNRHKPCPPSNIST